MCVRLAAIDYDMSEGKKWKWAASFMAMHL
jgi:hypothetical protein